MAKTRSGLGRGLGSLLGGGSDGTLPQEQASPVDRVVVDSDEIPAQRKPAVPVYEKKLPEKEIEELAVVEEKTEEEDVYSSKEDNVTIKSVTERKVQPAAPASAVEKTQQPEKAVADEPTNEVDIDSIEPNPNQPRTSFKKEELEELGESIKKNGLLQPILVRKNGEKYEIIAGERRWQACKNIGMKKVPVIIREADDDETIMLALVENIQRTDLNPIEEAYGYRRMMERGKMTQSEVAQAVSKGRSTIANALRLLELPEDAQQLLYEERITAGHARAILSVPTKEGRRKLTDKLMESQLSVRETEAIARLLSGKKETKQEQKPKAPKSYKTVARTLSDTFATTVKIKSVKGKNKIEIEFKDEADLERLFRAMTNSSR